MFVNEAVFILEQIAEHRLVPLYYFGLKNTMTWQFWLKGYSLYHKSLFV